jgi:phage terminase small subunit
VPILKNERHELFAQQLAQGKSATEAYEIAGFKPSRKNASRLRAKEDIAGRVGEIQSVAAQSAEITLAGVLRELDQAIEIARTKGQANAMVSAASLRSRLGGLLVDKQEVRLTDARDEQSIEGLADEFIAERILYFNAVDHRDRQAFIDMMNGWGEELKEFKAAIEARPHTVTRVDQTDLSIPWEQLNLQLKLVGRSGTNRNGR